jgi:dephospho-CoA kinase
VRLRRIVEARGVDEEEAKRMMAAQQPVAPKRARAAIVIDNDGTLEQLHARAGDVWRRIRERAG